MWNRLVLHHDRGLGKRVTPTHAVVLCVALACLSSEWPAAGQQEELLPRAPQSLTATVTNTTVTLRWTANPAGPGAETFQIQAGSSAGTSNLAIVNLPGGVTTFSANAPPGTYYVRVIAVNRFGASGPSNEVVVTTVGDCQLPGVPTGLSATPAPGSVTLRWSSGPGAPPTGHGLLVGSTPGATNIGTFAIGPATTLVAAAPNGTYYVRVFASNACGTSAPSAQVSFTVGAAVPSISVPAGIYDGRMFNHTNTAGRPPITSFVLQLNQPVPPTLQVISAVWTDNTGCRQSINILAGPSAQGPNIYLEQSPCNGGGRDLTLNIRAQSGNTYTGVCPLGGANCNFGMTRR